MASWNTYLSWLSILELYNIIIEIILTAKSCSKTQSLVTENNIFNIVCIMCVTVVRRCAVTMQHHRCMDSAMSQTSVYVGLRRISWPLRPSTCSKKLGMCNDYIECFNFPCFQIQHNMIKTFYTLVRYCVDTLSDNFWSCTVCVLTSQWWANPGTSPDSDMYFEQIYSFHLFVVYVVVCIPFVV